MKLKVMTWNVENLFATNANYQAKLVSLSATIAKVDPDVAALQEIGGDTELQALQGALASQGCLLKHSLIGRPDDRGIRVALLSKRPIKNEGGIEELASNFPIVDLEGKAIAALGRGAPHGSVTVDGQKVHVIGAHLKSKLLTFPNGQFSTKDEDLRARVGGIALLKRAAEAVTLRLAANKIIAKNDVDALILLGDLNDGPEAATTQILYGPTGSQPGTNAFVTPDQGDGARLFNLAGFIPKEQRFTRIHNGEGELIDHVLVSKELVTDGAGKRVLPVVYTVAASRLPSIDDNPNERAQAPSSDHAAVVAEFSL